MMKCALLANLGLHSITVVCTALHRGLPPWISSVGSCSVSAPSWEKSEVFCVLRLRLLPPEPPLSSYVWFCLPCCALLVPKT